jgi:hypothetical protein
LLRRTVVRLRDEQGMSVLRSVVVLTMLLAAAARGVPEAALAGEPRVPPRPCLCGVVLCVARLVVVAAWRLSLCHPLVSALCCADRLATDVPMHRK